jgi:ribosomal protein S18 acetylase RimI-like enzyme
VEWLADGGDDPRAPFGGRHVGLDVTAAAGDHEHARTERGQFLGDRAADPTRSTGHERSATVEAPHAARIARYDVRVIRLLGTADLRELVAHLRRAALESGRDGDVVFRPRSVDEPFDEKLAKTRHRKVWRLPVGTPQWARTWGLVLDGRIVGHADLHGGVLPAEQHRATLGLGIEREARGRGWGRALVETTIAWAREHGFAWLDLGVFAENAPARVLYAKLGFVELGTWRDRFRVDGKQIDDIQMTLAL